MIRQSGAGEPLFYHDFSREQWAALRGATPMKLREDDLQNLEGLGDVLSLREVEEIYLPLCRLLSLHIAAARQVTQVTGEFLNRAKEDVPFVIGVAGSVGVGKSTIARVLQALLAELPHRPVVDLVTTDGFLYPNAVLNERGLMNRKGFPESYDRRALIGFLAAVRSGRPDLHAPTYSHVVYDTIPDRSQVLSQPAILIVEGLNILQSVAGMAADEALVSDYLDFTIYVDADESDIREWYLHRFMLLRRTAFRDPASYFHRYAGLTTDEATATAARIWAETNHVNLVENILPTRGRARLILEKGPDHLVRRVRLRKV
ncbi:type I pantothenate kinase [Dactylosporangium sp. NPDC005555]|uniref:type I pantothenate kinase n=1 Tax=Dactylosporangium sp. NPDC005555 TaxID=3154889 RepID=UPI00339ECBCA